MELMRCITEREDIPNQITVGKKFWVEPKSKYKDMDGDEYISVYNDPDKRYWLGYLKTSHFKPVLRLEKDMDISDYANTHQSFILKDIIEWCKTAPNHTIGENIIRYVKDHELEKEENIYKSYVVNSIDMKEFIIRDQIEEFMKYCGVSLYCID